jgi:hypothetical protein
MRAAFTEPIDCWALWLELKKRYHRKQQKAVYLSSRDAAELLKCGINRVSRLRAELVHYGFTEMVRAAKTGSKGASAHYRLTDEGYLGKPPTKEYMFWQGVLYEPAQPKQRKPFPTRKPSKRSNGYVTTATT